MVPSHVARPAQPRVVLALGSNLGDRRDHLLRARRALAAAGLRPLAASPVVETDPVGGPPGQPRYLNQVVSCPVGAAPAPRALLALCLAIERAHGRVRRERWAARTLDIDLLFFGDRVVDEPGLVIPHPRLADRRFVLEPLVALHPELVHPVLGLTARELLARLGEPGGDRVQSPASPRRGRDAAEPGRHG
ncbi:MAG: 2-amino-4-hydroxy-6-hydroxymethyldihydropteridine diphosphokinase [Acidobacteriota bacterium]